MGLGILPPPGLAPAKAPLVQDFTTSGTWTKPAGAKYIRVECIGAGGSGAAVTSTSSHSVTGGCGGDYAERWFAAADLSSTESVAVGAGGTGVTGTSSGVSGNTGGASSFGTTVKVTATGGRGGACDLAVVLQNTVSTAPDSTVYFPYAPGSFQNGNGVTVYVPPNAAFGAGAGYSISRGGSGVASSLGGTVADGVQILKAGNGGGNGVAGTAPGGGGSAKGSTGASFAGASGQVRITTYF